MGGLRFQPFFQSRCPLNMSSVHVDVVLTLGNERGRAFLNGLVGERFFIVNDQCHFYVGILPIENSNWKFIIKYVIFHANNH